MSGVELGLAIAGAVDLCFKYGATLVKTCQAFKDADTRLNESILRVELCWTRLDAQLQIVRGLTAVMDERHQQVHHRALEVLLTKLQLADSKLAGLTKSSHSPSAGSGPAAPTVQARRWKLALLREGVDEAISELEAWQGRFDPTWFLMMRIASPEVDSLLEVTLRTQTTSSTPVPTARKLRRALKSDDTSSKSTIFLPPDGLVPGSIHSVPLSPVSIALRAGSDQTVLLDPVTCVSRPAIANVLQDIRNFAKKLRHADPFTFGLLECKGILKEEEESGESAAPKLSAPTGISFVFRLPATHTHVRSLRSGLLRSPGWEHSSLSERFFLAQQLVKAVSYVHIYGFVHKNIRPENVLILSRPGSGLPNVADDVSESEEERSEIAILVGFDVLRDAKGKTSRLGDDEWEKNLYRHPRRQGMTPEEDFEMRHDIYSVGVCLLEIGLWESFVVYDDHGARQSDEDELDEDESLAEAALNGLKLQSSHEAQPSRHLAHDADAQSGSELFKDPDRVKSQLLRLARGKVKRSMGTRYSKVVETCLTCLDEGNTDFGDDKEFQDEDGLAVGVRYIEKVVSQLGDIVV